MAVAIENYPSFEQAKKSIEKLRNASWPKYKDFENLDDYIKEVQNIIYNEFEILPNVFKFFKPKEFPLSIFRAREVSTFKNISLFTEHSYPPINLATFGRCNFPGNPVFYCSNNPMTALVEAFKDKDFKNKKFCISKWELIQNDKDFTFQAFLQTDLHKCHCSFVRKHILERKGLSA